MNRTALAPVLIIPLLLLATLAVSFYSIVNAEVTAFPSLKMMSPLSKNVYNSSEILLSFEVTTPQSWSEVFPGYSGRIFYHYVGVITSVGYSLDEKVSENVSVDDDTSELTIGPSSKVFDFSFNLTRLSDGPHNVTINVFGKYKGEVFNFSRSPIIFFVDIVPLELTVVSPENKIYNVTDIPLTVTTTEPVSWMGYSLDDRDRITFNQNITLTNMTVGLHRLTVFANDTLGNLASSETIEFTIAKPPEPFPVVPVAVASVASAGIIAMGLLVYFKKRKH